MPGLELPAGFLQHPFTDLHHQAELLQHRDEFIRWHQAACRVTPAQQRLDPGQAIAVAGKLRLIMQDELALLLSVAQIAFQFQTLQGTGVHVGLVELEVVLAAFLGVIHRGVGVLHQLAQLATVLRSEGDTDTGGDEEFAAFEDERARQAGENLLGDMNGAIQCALAGGARLQQQGEFVAAHARHGVVAVDAGRQAYGYVLEHAVAGGVAERIVDRLEAVEVEEHQHHPFVMPIRMLQGTVQAILEQGAVGQVGQGVVVGQTMDALFAGLAFADVAEETHVADQVAFLVMHRGDADPGREVLPTLALEPHLALPTAALVELAEDVLQVRRLLAVGGEHAWKLVEHLAGGITTDAAEGLVDLNDVTGRVGHQNRCGGVLEYRGGHAQVFFRAALLADVAANAEDAFEATVLVPHQHQAQLHRDLVAVGAQAVEHEQLIRQLLAQTLEAVTLAERIANPLEQQVQACELLRVSRQALQAVGRHPFGVVAEHGFHRRADVVQGQAVIGGDDHVADAFRQQAVALLAVTQRLVALDLLGDVLGHADQAADATALITRQSLLTDAEPVPLAIAVTPAQHRFEQQAVADHFLQVANAPVVFAVVRVQYLLPEVSGHRLELADAIAQLQSEAVVAEQHLPVLHVMHVEQVGHRANHFGPEALTLDQRQFDALAAGDVADAQGDGLIVLEHFRQAQHQPDVTLQALCGDQLGFQLHQVGAFEHGHSQAVTQIVGLYRTVVDQLLPSLFGGLDPEQVERHLVGLGNAQLLDQQLLMLDIGLQPTLQTRRIAQLVL